MRARRITTVPNAGPLVHPKVIQNDASRASRIEEMFSAKNRRNVHRFLPLPLLPSHVARASVLNCLILSAARRRRALARDALDLLSGIRSHPMLFETCRKRGGLLFRGGTTGAAGRGLLLRGSAARVAARGLKTCLNALRAHCCFTLGWSERPSPSGRRSCAEWKRRFQDSHDIRICHCFIQLHGG